MEQKEEKMKMKMEVANLSDEELQDTYGGSYWEIRVVYGRLVFIFHGTPS